MVTHSESLFDVAWVQTFESAHSTWFSLLIQHALQHEMQVSRLKKQKKPHYNYPISVMGWTNTICQAVEETVKLGGGDKIWIEMPISFLIFSETHFTIVLSCNMRKSVTQLVKTQVSANLQCVTHQLDLSLVQCVQDTIASCDWLGKIKSPPPWKLLRIEALSDRRQECNKLTVLISGNVWCPLSLNL